MNHRTPFRDSLNRLAHDLAEAVFEAIQEASLADVLTFLDEQVAASRGSHPQPTRAAVPSRPRQRARSAPLQPVERFEASAAEPDDASVITDPSFVLAALERAVDSTPALVVYEAEEASEEAPPPVEAETPHVAPPRADLGTSLRPGDEVLRTATGGLVLRRRRADTRESR